MINLLLVNASILITFLYLTSQLFRNTRVNSKSELKIRILVGFIFGVCGCILMFNGANSYHNMVFDFRLIALIISAIFCGPVSTIITALCILSFRIGYFSISKASLFAAANLVILSISLSYISMTKYTYTFKYICMTALQVTFTILSTFIIVKDIHLVFEILTSFLFVSIFVSFIIYYVLLYSFKTNELYLKLKQESSKDFLTGLNNVREFDLLFNKSITSALENKKNLSVLMLDIDYFKNINDTYGHTSGNLILKQFSEILIKSCRHLDIISRNGGEEFTVILLDCEFDQAIKMAERIRKNVQDYTFFTEKNEKIRNTVSIGVSSFPSVTSDIHSLLDDADKALYIAKHNGRNQVQWSGYDCAITQ